MPIDEIAYEYCPKCGSDLLKDYPDFRSQFKYTYEFEEASRYLYCKKCDCQVSSQEDINFCFSCGKKIEKPGYLYYEGRVADTVITEWPLTKKKCKECFLVDLEYIAEMPFDVEDVSVEIFGPIGAIIGGIIGFYYEGFFLAFILAIIFGIAFALTFDLMISLVSLMIGLVRGKGYKEISKDRADYIKKKYENIEKSSMHESISDDKKKGSIISAILWMTILSLLLGWIPIFGSLIAGYVGGKKAGSVSNAIIAVALPALLLAILIYTVFSSLPIVGALIAGAAFTIVIVYNLILLIGAVIGGASAGA